MFLRNAGNRVEKLTQIKEGVYKGEMTFTLKACESVHISGINCEVDYEVQEKKHNDFALHHVTQNSKKVNDISDETVGGNIDPEEKATEIVVFYNQSQLVELPDAGGMGMNNYYLFVGCIFGILLAIDGLLMLAFRKKKDKKVSP